MLDEKKSSLTPQVVDASLREECYRVVALHSFTETAVDAVIDIIAARGLIVREGFCVVPIEPTFEMCNATDPALVEGTYEAAEVYRQMIAAAQGGK